MSGFGVQQLSSKAQRAGAGGASAFAKAGRKGHWRGNVARDIMRGLLKGTTMPPPYWAQVPTRNPKTGENNVLVWLPFLLPHEVLVALWSSGAKELELSEDIRKNLEATCRSLGVDPKGFVPLGVHGDGVCNQANKSVVCFTWNILGCLARERALLANLGKDARAHPQRVAPCADRCNFSVCRKVADDARAKLLSVTLHLQSRCRSVPGVAYRGFARGVFLPVRLSWETHLRCHHGGFRVEH